jgi:hypothetical protein
VQCNITLISTFEECIRLGIKTLPNVWAGKAAAAVSAVGGGRRAQLSHLAIFY